MVAVLGVPLANVQAYVFIDAGPLKVTALFTEPTKGLKVADGTDTFTLNELEDDVPQLLVAVTDTLPLWVPMLTTMFEVP